MMDTLENFVSEKLGFLYQNHGFTHAHSLNAGEAGDALIEMRNEKLLVQIIRDRSQVSIYFASNQSPRDLFELSELIEILDGKSHAYQSTDPAAIEFLEKNFSSVNHLLVNDLSEGLRKRDQLRKETLRSLGYDDEGEE
jgi:hypothetical protein